VVNAVGQPEPLRGQVGHGQTLADKRTTSASPYIAYAASASSMRHSRSCCTSQSTTVNAPRNGLFGTVPFTCGSGAFGEDAKGHRKWRNVTYKGPLAWEGHSTFSVVPLKLDSPDDDYNINMTTPITNGHESGTTAKNKEEMISALSVGVDHLQPGHSGRLQPDSRQHVVLRSWPAAADLRLDLHRRRRDGRGHCSAGPG
jgi:hypothetical protein